jgi:hypothetical protein
VLPSDVVCVPEGQSHHATTALRKPLFHIVAMKKINIFVTFFHIFVFKINGLQIQQWASTSLLHALQL